MKSSEFTHLISAVLILAIVMSFDSLITANFVSLTFAIIFAFVIIFANVTSKKLTASKLDANVEHSIWQFQRYGFKPHEHYKKPLPFGIIVPLIGTAIFLGLLKISTILTYETSSLKRRAAKRLGQYSFTEMTDFHIALIGASGIITTLAVAFISYWIPGLELLTKSATYYAFWNLIPFSKLDGAQIYFGSRTLWTSLAIITLIFTATALFII